MLTAGTITVGAGGTEAVGRGLRALSMEIEENAANGLDVGDFPCTAGPLHCLPCSALSYLLFFSCEFLAPPLC